MNFEFSNPLRINELFRPILQSLVFRKGAAELDVLKEDVVLRIKNTYKKHESNNKILSGENLNIQVGKVFQESLDLLILNKLVNLEYPKLDISLIDKEVVAKSDPLLYLSDKAKMHIQSEEPIKFISANGETLYILDFLP